MHQKISFSLFCFCKNIKNARNSTDNSTFFVFFPLHKKMLLQMLLLQYIFATSDENHLTYKFKLKNNYG